MLLREATFNDWKILLEWRNNPDTRKNSLNNEVIDIDTHKKWLKKVLSNKNIKLFIVIESDIPVGTVRADYDEESNSFKLSWTVAPDYRGKGLGKRMVKLLVDKLNSKVKAEIKKENISSLKIAQYAGLHIYKEKNGICYLSNF